MALTYAQYLAEMASLMAYEPSDEWFLQQLPSAINYAELRIYRELDLLATRVVDQTATVTANSRNFTLPATAGPFVVVEQISIFTPVSTTTTRVPLTPVSVDFINVAWPSDTAASASTVPQYFAMLTQAPIAGVATNKVLLGPPPGAAYTAEVIGTVRPAPLSADNTQTFLSTYLSDLFVAASMVFMTGAMKNFGAQADDPKAAQSWQAQYDQLKASADNEEMRKMFAGASWTSKRIEPGAVPQRG